MHARLHVKCMCSLVGVTRTRVHPPLIIIHVPSLRAAARALNEAESCLQDAWMLMITLKNKFLTISTSLALDHNSARDVQGRSRALSQRTRAREATNEGAAVRSSHG